MGANIYPPAKVDEKKYRENYDRIFGNNLKQCPYSKACMCLMDEPCEGCETWAEYQEEIKDAR